MDYKNYEEFVNQDFSSFSDWLFSLDAYEFSLIAAAIGFAISKNLTVNQQNSLGNFFELAGQVMLTINAQAATRQQQNSEKSSIKPYIEYSDLKEEILSIKREVIKLRQDALSNYKI